MNKKRLDKRILVVDINTRSFIISIDSKKPKLRFWGKLTGLKRIDNEVVKNYYLWK